MEIGDVLVEIEPTSLVEEKSQRKHGEYQIENTEG